MGAAAYGQLNIEESPPPCGSRNVDCFQNLEKIGEGTYGQVYMARELKTAKIVALKKLRLDMENYEKEGFPMTAIREIKILKKLQHINVVKLKEVVTSSGPEVDEHGKSGGNKYKGSIFVVFEYMDHDLMGLSVRHGLQFTTPQIKCYMKQLLTGLHYCHANQVLHRDIKSANILIDNEGNLKLADFGLAQSYSRDIKRNLANNVVTLPYRPPELLLGCTKYGPSVDMWSVGCVFGELLLKKIILPGKTELEQLEKISELCGFPNEVNWPGVSKLPWYEKYKKENWQMKRGVREVFRDIDRNALELLEKLLTLDPSQRISAKDALDAEYFWADPLPCDPKSLPKYESSHEFQMEMKRQQLQYEETSKRQKIQQHARLPPMQQSGQAHSQHWAGGHSHPVGNTSHHYSRPSGGPMCYPPRNNLNPQGGVGFNGEHYPPQVCAPPVSGPRGSSAGYGVDPPPYSQNVPYGGTSGAGGRGPNVAGNRNQQYR